MRDGLPSWRLPPLGECPETLKSGVFATVLQESAGTFLGTFLGAFEAALDQVTLNLYSGCLMRKLE
jgi:hypothetical protein